STTAGFLQRNRRADVVPTRKRADSVGAGAGNNRPPEDCPLGTRLSGSRFGLVLHPVKSVAEEKWHGNQLLNENGTAVTPGAAAKKSEPLLRRYFYDTLASYLALYIRPEDRVIEIAPGGSFLGKRFANYRALPSGAAPGRAAGRLHFVERNHPLRKRYRADAGATANLPARFGADIVRLLQHVMETACAFRLDSRHPQPHSGTELDRP